MQRVGGALAGAGSGGGGAGPGLAEAPVVRGGARGHR